MANRQVQERDADIVDYGLWPLPAGQLEARGPAPDLSEGYVVGIGACQTFGRLVEAPFLSRLSAMLGMPALNLGFVAAGPAFFLGRPKLLDLAAGARLAVVETMSAQAVATSRFALGTRNDRLAPRTGEAAPTPAEQVLAAFAEASPPAAFGRLVAEARQRYVAEMRSLLDRLPVPAILLHLSTEPPPTGIVPDALAPAAPYPSWVTDGVLEALRPHAAALVSCVTGEGAGEPAGHGPLVHGARLPSPAMHAAAADALLPVAQKVLASPRPRSGRPVAARRKLVLHVHIFKVAGTSVERNLRASFGPRWAQAEPADPTDPAEWQNSAFLVRLLAARPDLEAVSSHNVRRPFDLPGTDVYPIVFLRHPIDRIRSHYDFERKSPGRQSIIQNQKANALDFPDFIDWVIDSPDMRHVIMNLQTRILSLRHPGRPGEREIAPNEVNLDEALAFVADLPVVGIVERFEQSLARLSAWLRPSFPQVAFRPVQANVSQATGSTLADRLQAVEDQLGPRRYRRLVEANAFDLHLYAYAHEKMGYAPMEAVLGG